jgi:hypothetical protein
VAEPDAAATDRPPIIREKKPQWGGNVTAANANPPLRFLGGRTVWIHIGDGAWGPSNTSTTQQSASAKLGWWRTGPR